MTDDELIKWMAQGHKEIELKPVDWNAPEEVWVGTARCLKYEGRAHDQFLRFFAVKENRERLEKLGFCRTRPEGVWRVTFVQPVDSEAHAYFPQPDPDTDREPPSTMEAITAFIELDKKYTVSEIVESLATKGYERDRIADQIDKLVKEEWLKRFPDGRVFNPAPFGT